MTGGWPTDLESIVQRLATEHPVLGTMLDWCTMEEGDVLCTQFFGFLQTEILDQLKARSLDSALVAVVLDLEAAFATADGRARNEISVGILEHLPNPGEPGGEINALLGPTLTAAATHRPHTNRPP